MRQALLIAALLAPLAAHAAPPAPPVLTATGKSQSCVSRTRTRTIERVDDKTLLFRFIGSAGMRSDLRNACDYDPNRDVIAFSSPSASLCEGEALQLQDRYTGIFRSSCIVGPFTPVKVERAPR